MTSRARVPRRCHPPHPAERTLGNREFLVAEAVRILRAFGATRVYRPNWLPLLLHFQSTMRMGLSATDSVLDEGGEARWVPRLFVADNSALPNALGGANPMLTTTGARDPHGRAHLRAPYFGGTYWVRRENPVSSNSNRVSRAVIERGP